MLKELPAETVWPLPFSSSSSSDPCEAGTFAGCGVGEVSNADLGVADVDPDANPNVFGGSFDFLLSGDEPPARSMSLKATPDAPVLPNALALLPLNALKALLDGVFEALGVALGLADGVEGEPNAGCANPDIGFGGVPMTLV